MTTFCLIHGAWHDGTCWEPLAAALDTLNGVDGDHVIVGHSLGSGYAPIVAVARPGSLLVLASTRDR